MNKMKKYLLMLAALFVVAITFTACSSEDDLANAEEEQERGVVKAQFNISIPQAYKSAHTRSTDFVVQEGTNGDLTDLTKFRGIADIYLFPFAKDNDNDGDTQVEALTSKGRIRLSQILKPTVAEGNYVNQIPSQKLLKGNNAILFGDVDVTINTNHFLFYGHAIDETSTNGGNKFMNGSIIPYDISDPNNPVEIANTSYASITPSNLSFQLEGILADETKAGTKETAILNFLNAILHASATVGSTTVTWANTNSLDLKILYNNFKGMRAGSSASLQAAIEMLYFKGLLSKKTNANNDLDEETVALATAICKVIEDNTDVTLTDETLTFNSTSNLAGYPEMMPAGSAVLGTQTDTNGVESFTYVLPNTTDSYFVDATALNVPAKARYVYPANLYYFGNSGILVSNALKTDLYDDDNTTSSTSKDLWEQIANTTNFSDGAKITSETKSIAIKDQVQYAVGRLDVKVSTYKDGSGQPTTLEDATKIDANKVSINDLKLTGVLIGGQRAVNWKFDSESAPDDQYIIYDNIIKSCKLDDNDPKTGDGIAVTNSAFANITNTTGIGYNHTLVLQTKKYTAASGEGPSSGDQTVNVLLEFQNNGKAFEGKDGTIGKGCKFYLLGVLDMSKLTDSAVKSDYIFQQDYITCANFTIASLEKAVNVIPDLRDPQIELGLSVNLTWNTGNTFDIEIP